MKYYTITAAESRIAELDARIKMQHDTLCLVAKAFWSGGNGLQEDALRAVEMALEDSTPETEVKS